MTAAPQAGIDAAIWCTEWDLATGPDEITAVSSWPGNTARILIRWHGETIEFVQLPLSAGSVSRSTVIERLTEQGRRRIHEHVKSDGALVEGVEVLSAASETTVCLNQPTTGPRVSIVVCTRNRGPALRQCLVQLEQLEYHELEVVIVDNAPSDSTTLETFRAQVGDNPRFRYVLEPRPGLSRARNRGLIEATGEIIAYTDDDVRVDARWVSGLISGFRRRRDIACVTSLICTAELGTPAEHYFDGKVSWASSCEPRVFDLATPSADPLYPYAPGLFGAGAGMAFRVDALLAIGGFDEALGAGTRSAGGEDLDIFVRILQSGRALAYEPSSIVWHHHRADLEGLRRQMFGYGSGLTAYVTKHLLDSTSRKALISRIPRGVAHMATVAKKSQKTAPTVGPVPARSLLIREIAGMAAGPVLYLAARRQLVADRPACREAA